MYNIESINEYCDTLIKAKRYDIMNESNIKLGKLYNNSKFYHIITDKTLNGVKVTIYSNLPISKFKEENVDKYKDELLSSVSEKLKTFDKDFAILKKSFPNIEKEIMKYLESYGSDWDVSIEDIKKHAHLDFIEYNVYNGKGKFYIWYNNTDHGDRNMIFGGHSISADIIIKDNKAVLSKYSPSLEG